MCFGRNPNITTNNAKKNNNGRKKKVFEFQLDLKNIFLIIIIGFLLLSVLSSFSQFEGGEMKKPLSNVLEDIKAEKVQKITVEDNKLTIKYKDGKTATSNKEVSADIYSILKNAGINPDKTQIDIKDTMTGATILNMLVNAAGIIIPILFFLWIFRQARGAQDSIFLSVHPAQKFLIKNNQKLCFLMLPELTKRKKS